MSQYMTVGLNRQETFFLFDIMGFQDQINYFHLSEENTQGQRNRNKEWLEGKSSLLKDNLIMENGDEYTIHPSLFLLLQSCKLCNTVATLSLQGQSEKIRAQYFISYGDIIEFSEVEAESKYVFTRLKDKEECLDIIGNYLDLSNESSSDSRGTIKNQTFSKIFNEFPQLTEEQLQSLLLEENSNSAEFVQLFASAWKNVNYLSDFTFSIREMNGWKNQKFTFLICSNGNWLLIPNEESFDVFYVNATELLQSIFLLITPTLT